MRFGRRPCRDDDARTGRRPSHVSLAASPTNSSVPRQLPYCSCGPAAPNPLQHGDEPRHLQERPHDQQRCSHPATRWASRSPWARGILRCPWRDEADRGATLRSLRSRCARDGGRFGTWGRFRRGAGRGRRSVVCVGRRLERVHETAHRLSEIGCQSLAISADVTDEAAVDGHDRTDR